MTQKIHLAFLWHQHQPVYRETPVSGQQATEPYSVSYSMPWVRLHATKDYFDMVAILDEFPSIKLNFNLVPSLMIQLDEYARGVAYDKLLLLTLKPANELTDEDKIYVLYNFFMSNWETMVQPYPRYYELLNKRGKYVPLSEINRIQKYMKEQDYRDLQVWFNLSWMDPYWKWNDPLIKKLFEKGKNYTEEEKLDLMAKQKEICGKVVSKYKEMQEKGQIEVSVTPFYHPILPLLCNTDIAKFGMPGVFLPKKFSRPEDAQAQIRKAVGYYEKIFGVKPRGMWPSEGSVSEDIIGPIADAGINWIATDEQILYNTIAMQQSGVVSKSPRELFYQPYLVEKNTPEGVKSLNIIFRDRVLSDSIGFVYSHWDPNDAANDFITKIHRLKESLWKDKNSTFFIPVILDGENCWEFYRNDGWDFLRALYSKLSSDPEIETVTISDFLKEHPSKITLKHLFPGSWINANFGVWIGHQEDNLAWEFVLKTRNMLDDYIKNNPEKKDSTEVKCAFEELYIAEGSDWNWWYGDDHSSGQDEMFDYLFRKHLMNVYDLLGQPVPDEFYITIKGKFLKKEVFYAPKDIISPKIDGKITNYFEWLSAGFYYVGHSGGTMHQVESIISKFYYGFDMENFFLRIDLRAAQTETEFDKIVFQVLFLSPLNKKLSIKINKTDNSVDYSFEDENGAQKLDTIAFQKIIELSMPFSLLNTDHKNQIEFVVLASKILPDQDSVKFSEIERWPYQETVKFIRPAEDFSMHHWS
ncbi:MAG: glycoside hydrolase family 57 protein [Elusimicrobiota bacterium]